MFKCLLSILLIAVVNILQAQTPQLGPVYDPDPSILDTDSLHQLLARATASTTRVDLFILLAQGHLLKNKDSALWYTQKATDLAQKINYPRGQFGARTRMALVFRDVGNYPKAIDLLFTNLKIAEHYKDTLRMYFMEQYLSLVYYEMNDFARQLHYARKVQQLVHSGYFKTEKEVLYYSLRGHVTQVASAFEGLNQLDSALYYWQLSYKIASALKDNQRIAFANIGWASTLAKKGRYDESLSHYRTAIDYEARTGRGYSEVAGREDMTAQSKLGMAKLFNQKGQGDSARYYAQTSLRTYELLKLPASELKVDLFLSELYAKQNRTDSGYKYLARATVLKDSLFNQEKTRQVQNLQFNETLRLQQLEQERKEARQQYQVNLKLYSLIGGLAVVLAGAFFLYQNNKAKHRANALLQRQKKKLEEALEELKATQAQLIQREKMASLGELTAGIAHEIQNPLNFVNNFSEINTELIEELRSQKLKVKIERDNQLEDELLTDIKENEQKINLHGKRADAIVKSMLEHSRASKGRKEPTDINTLADEYLKLSYHGLCAKDKSFNATIDTHFDESIDKINVVPQDIGRVLLNLFNNAFYAVNKKKKQQPEGYEPTVTVTTKKAVDKIEIAVKDNGTGIPQKVVDKIFQPFFTTKPTGQGTGLGLSLSYDIIKAHNGEIRVESKEGEGSEFIIQLPIYPNNPLNPGSDKKHIMEK